MKGNDIQLNNDVSFLLDLVSTIRRYLIATRQSGENAMRRRTAWHYKPEQPDEE